MTPATFTLAGKKGFLWQRNINILLLISTLFKKPQNQMFSYSVYHTDDFPQVCCGRHHVDTAQLSPELDLKIAFPAKTVCCFRSFFPQISSKAQLPAELSSVLSTFCRTRSRLRPFQQYPHRPNKHTIPAEQRFPRFPVFQSQWFQQRPTRNVFAFTREQWLIPD